MNFIGAGLRVISIIDSVRHNDHHLAFIVAMTGQVFTAIAQPFFLYSPTKLSASWFSEQQRAIATMFASMGECELCLMTNNCYLCIYIFILYFSFDCSKSCWYWSNLCNGSTRCES